MSEEKQMKISTKSSGAMDTSQDTSSSHLSIVRTVYRFKIILLGDVAVGKTAILTKFTKNKIDPEHTSTLGVEYKLKSLLIDNQTAADLQLWDTCGQEKYKTITRNYYRDTNGNINL
jgi:small GTP-binding protein